MNDPYYDYFTFFEFFSTHSSSESIDFNLFYQSDCAQLSTSTLNSSITLRSIGFETDVVRF